MRIRHLKNEESDGREDIMLKDLESGAVFCFDSEGTKSSDDLYMVLQCEADIEDDDEDEDEEEDEDEGEELPNKLIPLPQRQKNVIGVANMVTGLFVWSVEEAVVIPQDGYYVLPPR